MKININTLAQFIKFGIVGLSNTFITALLIWFLLKYLYFNDFVANIIGYIAGLTNSFIWNKRWTFRSNSKVQNTIFKFIITFVISYIIQLGILYVLLHLLLIDPYWCHLFAMIVYTLINFVLNKFYTFTTNTK